MTLHTDRRNFLKWLAASPLAAYAAACAGGGGTGRDPGMAAATPGAGAAAGGAAPALHSPPASRLHALATSAEEALDIADLEAVAAANIPPSHWGYLMTGVDDDATMAANRRAFDEVVIRARRLVDVSTLDTRVDLLGRSWPTPIVLAPAGSQRAYHTEGELAAARAARARNHLQVLSTVSSTGVEAVNEARGEPVWYQLYPTSNWDVTRTIIRRVEDAECPVLVLTVDLPVSSNRLTQERWRRVDERRCAGCHTEGGQAPPVKPMYQGTPYRPEDFRTPALTWEFVDRLKDTTEMKVVVKGLVTGEDAGLALAHGADAVWVSNHGGRAEPSGRGTLDVLPEIADAMAGRAPIILDSGVRRGADVFKALALGATAVAVGRPYLWGLGAFGQEGVERALEILRTELEITMQLSGTPTLASIGAGSVARR